MSMEIANTGNDPEAESPQPSATDSKASGASSARSGYEQQSQGQASQPRPHSLREHVGIADIWRAYEVLRDRVHHTPILPSRTLSAMTGAKIMLKAENLQRSGSFKIRGATYKMQRLTPAERQRGVITASAGNHAQGVAIAAREAGVPCTIVMPADAPLAKVVATQGYGATVVLHGADYDEAYEHCCELQRETGARYIPAFDDPDIIAGQGTLGLEILSDLPDVDAIVVPVGGGGLISGVAIAAKALKPDITIIGVQASGCGAVYASLKAHEIHRLPAINTIADGIAVKRPGDLTFAIIERYVDDVVLVDDEAIINAVLFLMERCKLLVEGAGAVGLAALLSGVIALPGKLIAVPLTGGNIDINLVSRFIQHGLSATGRYLVIHTLLPDRPGQLLGLLRAIAAEGVNVLDIAHHRTGVRLPIQQVEVMLTLETRDRAHCDRLLEVLRSQNYIVSEIRPTFVS
jgi:threonine dehydratase